MSLVLLFTVPVPMLIAPTVLVPVSEPPKTRPVFDPVTVPRFRRAVVGLNVGADAVTFTDPKVTAGVPPLTLVPEAIVSVFAPMVNVPSVWLMPALAGVALSDRMVRLPARVRLYGEMLVFPARSRVSPWAVKIPEVDPKAEVLLAMMTAPVPVIVVGPA